jgi:hypothetical protein
VSKKSGDKDVWVKEATARKEIQNKTQEPDEDEWS